MNGEKIKWWKRWKWKAIYLALFDILMINGAYLLGLLIRFDFRYSQIPIEYLSAYVRFAPVYTVVSVAIFTKLRMYNSLWKYVSFSEINRIMCSSILTTIFHTIGITLLFERMPLSYYVFGPCFQFLMITASRFAYRFMLIEKNRREEKKKEKIRVLLIGAGESGRLILRELQNSDKSNAYVCGIIDDNREKWGRFLEGVKVLGGRDKIKEVVEANDIQKIFLVIPTISAADKKEILDICNQTNAGVLCLPGVYQLANEEVTLSKLRPVSVEDLLGREPIRVNMTEIFEHIKGKCILVTGGGGSIGSELCRQIAAHKPRQLIIFDIYENNAYEIEQELKRKYHDTLNMSVIIGSVRDRKRIEQIFAEYRPEIVFHAAAHKHVPLMENSPNEAIKNNVMGTFYTANAAYQYGTERFVLISTDKAVNPTNIMGASKRLCEMIIQSMDALSQKEQRNIRYVAVRFGNVLGSNGSVIPLFRQQIAEGGPVTVTHPDIIRYFMTIPEAVSLVLQASVYAKGGEIFVLDMGNPVKIDTLARNLIHLSGYVPDVDIKIVYTGLRPGEKLYEEKLMAEEGLLKTENKLIHIGKPIAFDTVVFWDQLAELFLACEENPEDIRASVEKIVPTYHPAQTKQENLQAEKKVVDNVVAFQRREEEQNKQEKEAVFDRLVNGMTRGIAISVKGQ